jgi:hypothetical protein
LFLFYLNIKIIIVFEMSPTKRKAGDMLTFERPKPKLKAVETMKKAEKVKV